MGVAQRLEDFRLHERVEIDISLEAAARVLAGLVADVMSLLGGWQMYQGIADGKRLVIYGLAIGFVAQIVSALGYASIGSLILPILVILVVYYLVVISRFPGPAPSV